jgi:hypothetical protein
MPPPKPHGAVYRRSRAGRDAGVNNSQGLRSKPKPKIAMDGDFGQRKG